MSRRLASFLVVLGWVLTAALAVAAPRDKAAQKKIEEAIYTNFLNTDFDAAEGLLLGTVRACEDKCSPGVVAKAWMYVGVVRGSGRQDLAGALEAFQKALAADKTVALDNEIATDPVKATFEKAKGGGGGGGGGSAGAAFTCTPSPTEVETRRPVPMQCETDADLTGARLFYKSFSGSWTAVQMEQTAGTWRGTIPCSATQSTGKLKFYVEGLKDDKTVASLGEKDKPKSTDVVSETSADPPAYPEEEAPARCGVTDEPSDTPKPAEGGECIAYGAKCGDANCCEGLACISGTCVEAECQSDSDCKDGAECKDGKCDGGEASGEYAKNIVGIHFGIDFASISADKACAGESRDQHFACFDSAGNTYSGTPYPGAAGKINGGFTLATMRVMASYERLFGTFGAEARLGFAFNGGKQADGGSAFLPVHAEARLKYWILGEKAFTKPGLRPWVHVGGGIAQVDATVKASVADCGTTVNPACTGAASLEEATSPTVGKGSVRTYDVTKQLGVSFATVGGGVMYAVGKTHGVILNLNFMIPFPSTGFVIEPSLGYGVGF